MEKDLKLVLSWGFALACVGVAAYASLTVLVSGPSIAATVTGADRAECFLGQIDAERAMVVYQAEHDVAVGDLDALVPGYLEELPECPSGGVLTSGSYSDLPKVTCSEHGSHFDDR